MPGSIHDKKLHDETKLIYDKKAKPFSDLGYYGAKRITMPIKKPKLMKLTVEEKKFNRLLSKQSIIVEHTIEKMKIFQILSQRYRNALTKNINAVS